MKVWRSREMARATIFGSVDESYKLVPALSAELVKKNPDSHIIYDYNEDDNSFKRFYISFKVCIDGFLVGCRHLVGVDACHLKSKYLGVLLAATSLDGNNGLFTLAIAVVESESKSSWKWFLKNLNESFGGEVEPLAFISNMEKGLGDAMKNVFPNAEHRACLRHLWKNIKKYYRCHDSKKIQSLFWLAANAYTKSEFDIKFNQLLAISPQLHDYLLKLPYKWSKSQFMPEIRSQYNTNNMSESFNSWIGEARAKPIIDLVDMIRGMLMKQRAQRRESSSRWRGELVPVIEEYIRDITTRKDPFIVRKSTIYKAEVEGLHERHVVDIENKECSCRYWQMTGLPCIHAVAFIGTKEHQLWHTYVDEHYHITRYKMAYEGAIATLPDKNQWIAIDDNVDVVAPNTLRPRGRPKKRRIKSFLENGSKKSRNIHKCGRCGNWGHHRNTCKSPLTQSNSEMPDVDIDAYVSELSYADFGSRSKLPIGRE